MPSLVGKEVGATGYGTMSMLFTNTAEKDGTDSSHRNDMDRSATRPGDVL